MNLFAQGPLASRPDPTAANAGGYYYASDTRELALSLGPSGWQAVASGRDGSYSSGAASARPGPFTAGLYYFSEDSGLLAIANGSAWADVAGALDPLAPSSGGGVQVADVVLTAAEVKASAHDAVILVPAPGPGKMIQVQSVGAVRTGVSAAFGLSLTVALEGVLNAGSTGLDGGSLSAVLAQSASSVVTPVSSQTPQSPNAQNAAPSDYTNDPLVLIGQATGPIARANVSVMGEPPGGQWFKVGDIVSDFTSPGPPTGARFRVTEVDGMGAATGLELLDAGSGYSVGTVALYLSAESQSLSSNAVVEIKATAVDGGGAITAWALQGAGSGYAVGDTGTIIVGGGDAAYVVDAVDGNGGVTAFRLTAPGTGYSLANNNSTATGGSQPGTGHGFAVDITGIDASADPGDGTLTVSVAYAIVDLS